MRILVLSRTAWRKDNSFGNTYSNIFGGMRDAQIANIYLGEGVPDADNDNVIAYYRISEKEMTKSVLKPRNKNNQVGTRVSISIPDGRTQSAENYEKALVDMKKKRWPLFFILRELVWRFGQPNLDDMMSFVEDFRPDIIFLSFYYAAYVDRIALYIKSKVDIPLVLEAAIDIYSLKQLSFDPFYWINRFYIRRMIRKTVKNAEKLYVISEKMKYDYAKMLRIDCDVLYKFPDLARFSNSYKRTDRKPIFLYTGNIGNGRWTTLGKLGDELFNQNAGKLVIYTPTFMNNKMYRALSHCDVKPPVSPEKIKKLQNDADVLVHAESFNLKDSLEVRYSISTKIMDYISCGRCILAIGPKWIASMEYLSKNNLAITCNSNEDLNRTIQNIKEHPELIEQFSNTILAYSRNTLSREEQQNRIKNDLEQIIMDYSKRNIELKT